MRRTVPCWLAMTAAGKTQRLIDRELRCTEVAVNARGSVLAARLGRHLPIQHY
jgi:hypothetical protein